MTVIYECVLNISEGKDASLISSITQNANNTAIDVHRDPDHNRSVITLGSSSLDILYRAAQLTVEKTCTLLSLQEHAGVHPRLGTIDVCPFVSYDENSSAPTPDLIEASHQFGQWVYSTFGIPVFYYDQASETQLTLPFVRKNAFHTLEPSLGNHPHPHHGALCVGARDILIAINVNIDSEDIDLARAIARDIRESSGGMAGVRAIGLPLASQSCVQVSMNLVSPTVDVEQVCTLIRNKAENHRCTVELIGLLPDFVYRKLDNNFLSWSMLDESITIEKRLVSS